MTPEEVKLLVERLKDECFCGLCPTCEAASALTLLAQEREELREALKFYADWKNYRQSVPATTHIEIMEDEGDRARSALKDT